MEDVGYAVAVSSHKKMKIALLHIVLLLMLYSCKNETEANKISTNQKEASITSITKDANHGNPVAQNTTSPPSINRDSIYTSKRNQANNIRNELANILKKNRTHKIKETPGIEFISGLDEQIILHNPLRLDSKNREDNVVLPIYKFSDSLIGVLVDNYQEDSLYTNFSIGIRDTYDRLKERNNIKPINGAIYHRRDFLKHDSLSRAKMSKIVNNNLYVYGSQGYTRSLIEDYIFYIDECTHYEFYKIMTVDTIIGQPLFASKFFIDLNYQFDPALLQIPHMKLITSGCCAKDNSDKIYATINGHPEYVLMYDDSNPYNGKVNYASRSIFYNSADTLMVPLMYMQVDFFRDECL